MDDSNEKMDKTIIDTIKINKDDVILLKGEWQEDVLQSFAQLLISRKKFNILIVVPEEKSIEKIPVDEFYLLLKEIEKRKDIKNPTEVKLKKAIKTLEQLAKLGNGDHYGNSDGNCIAIDCLNKIS